MFDAVYAHDKGMQPTHAHLPSVVDKDDEGKGWVRGYILYGKTRGVTYVCWEKRMGQGLG